MNAPRLYLFLAALAFVMGCDKDRDQSGCTDPLAVNYDPRALRSNGDCVYNDAQQLIWSNGTWGGWNGNLMQGGFIQHTCAGTVEIIEQVIDSIPADSTLPSGALVTAKYKRLGASQNGAHKSYISLLNTRNGTNFAEGSLRFSCRLDALGSPAVLRLFVNGKLPDQGQGCPMFLRSDYVDISTASFTDSTFTEVNIPMRDFAKLRMAQIDVICGFEYSSIPGSGLIIDNLRWVAHFD
jgi:hypothetical protein